MKYTIDRFEGETAVCELEDLSFVNIPKKALPKDCKEGDIILITIDASGTSEKRDQVKKLMNDLFVD